MGYVKHDATLVTIHSESALPDIDKFRESLPAEWRPLVIGPIETLINGYVSYAFLPDGSYQGWDLSDEGDVYRQQFADLFSNYLDAVVHVKFGGDDETVLTKGAER